MATEHKYAQVLRWIADGKEVLARYRGGAEGRFPDQFTHGACSDVFKGEEGYEFRLKPRTVNIGSREVEAPVLEPTGGQTVWYWDSVKWGPAQSKGSQQDWARDGHYFASPEACRAAHEALAVLMRGES